MDGKLTKVCAVAVVLAFAITVFAVIPTDDTYASDSTKTYDLHFDEINESYVVTKSIWISFQTSDSTLDSFIASANKAFAAYGIDAAFNATGWISSTTYGSSFTTYVAKDGAWVSVASPADDYIAASVIAIEAGAGSYIYGTEPPAAEASNYNGPDEWGMYYRNPSVGVNDFGNTVDYRMHFEAVSAEYAVTDSIWMTVRASGPSLGEFAAAANATFQKYGIDAAFNATTGWISSTTYGSSFTTYVAKDGAWASVASPADDYIAASVIAIEAGAGSYIYGTEPPAAEASNYNGPDEWGIYYRNPSAAPNADTAATYHVSFDVIADDYSLGSNTQFKFVSDDNNMKAFKVAANIAFIENGIDAAFSDAGWISSTTYGSNFTTWTSDGNKWTSVASPAEDYLSAKAIGIEAGAKSYIYGDVPPADYADKYSGPDEWGMYYRMPSVSADFYKGSDDNSSNKGLILVGIVSAILVVGFAYLFIGKKH